MSFARRGARTFLAEPSRCRFHAKAEANSRAIWALPCPGTRPGVGSLTHARNLLRGVVREDRMPAKLRLNGAPAGRAADAAVRASLDRRKVPLLEAQAGRASGFKVYRARRSSRLGLMSGLPQGVGHRLTYIPRFIHHFKQRRQLGQSVGPAFRSARERMRHYQ